MPQSRHQHPSLLLDLAILAVGAALLVLALRSGLQAGVPVKRGLGAIIGGLYIIYLGVLFLLSYFFSEASYVFSLLTYICEAWSTPAGRRMAWLFFALGAVLGSWVLLVGLGLL